MSDRVTRKELEELEGEVLPERAAMSLVDVGSTLIGFHGPTPPVPLPAEDHVPPVDGDAEPPD
jgi:hypothetical protein